MATKIYKQGGAIIAENTQGTNDKQIINPSAFDWSVDSNGVYSIRDKIQNQSYTLGALADITDKNDTVFSNSSDLEYFLNGLVNVSDVFLQDQSTEIIDLHLTKLVQEITLINNTNIDDATITISSVAEPVNGNVICLKEDTAFYQGKILSHVANGLNWDITLDTPLDYAFTTLGGCSERIENLNVDGSVTRQIFSVSPEGLQAGTQWDITRIIIQINDDAAMDDGKFGGLTALAKGVVFRSKNGVTKNIFNAKTNGDLAAHMYDVEYISATLGPGGQYGLRARRSFAGQDKNGVVIRLNADTSDALELIIQDNLTGLTNFQIIAQGHIVSR